MLSIQTIKSSSNILKDTIGQKLLEKLNLQIIRWFPRNIRYWFQRRIRGWDDSVTWSLNSYIAQWTLPKLRRFKQLNNGYPPDFTEEGWNNALDDMIYALEICEIELDTALLPQDIDTERFKRGLELFGKHFRDLWW